MSEEMSEGVKTYVVTLPSGAVAEMRGWSLGFNLSEVGKRGSEISRLVGLLNRCLVKVHDPGPYTLTDSNRLEWMDVAECDINSALIAARIATHGPDLVIKQRCPNHVSSGGRRDVDTGCAGYIVPIEDVGNSDQIDFRIQLDNVLENHQFVMPPETVDGLKRGENRFRTELDGIEIEFAVPTGRILTEASKKSGGKGGDTQAKTLAWSIACQLHSLDGIVGREAVFQALLSDRFPPGLIHAFGALKFWTGGIDSEVVVACNACGWMPDNEDGAMDLPFAAQPQFFAGPEKRLKNQPTRQKRRVPASG
jgi:hypothetical protein